MLICCFVYYHLFMYLIITVIIIIRVRPCLRFRPARGMRSVFVVFFCESDTRCAVLQCRIQRDRKSKWAYESLRGRLLAYPVGTEARPHP